MTRGETTRRFAKSLTEHAETHAEAPDLDMSSGYHGVDRDRRRAAGYALYASLGISKEDRDARVAQRLKNFDFFGAPHVAIVTTDREQGAYGAIDCGGYVTNLLLAAQSLGVATIPQAAVPCTPVTSASTWVSRTTAWSSALFRSGTRTQGIR